jgi:hypothetical protein
MEAVREFRSVAVDAAIAAAQNLLVAKLPPDLRFAVARFSSLIANKFSLPWRLGNSVGKRLNFIPKAEAPWLSQRATQLALRLVSNHVGCGNGRFRGF